MVASHALPTKLPGQQDYGARKCFINISQFLVNEEGNLVRKEVEYKQYGITIGKYPAEVCSKCGEIFFDEKAVDKIEKKMKEMKLCGLRRRVKIGTSGNALDIKLSKNLVDLFEIQKGQEVEVTPIDKSRFEVSIA